MKKFLLGLATLVVAIFFGFFNPSNIQGQVSPQQQPVGIHVFNPEGCNVKPNVFSSLFPREVSAERAAQYPLGIGSVPYAYPELLAIEKLDRDMVNAIGSYGNVGVYTSAKYPEGPVDATTPTDGVAFLRAPLVNCDYTEGSWTSIPMNPLVTSLVISEPNKTWMMPEGYQITATVKSAIQCGLVVFGSKQKSLCLQIEDWLNPVCNPTNFCPQPGQRGYPHKLGFKTIQQPSNTDLNPYDYDRWATAQAVEQVQATGLTYAPWICQFKTVFNSVNERGIYLSDSDCPKISDLAKAAYPESDSLYLVERRTGHRSKLLTDMNK